MFSHLKQKHNKNTLKWQLLDINYKSNQSKKKKKSKERNGMNHKQQSVIKHNRSLIQRLFCFRILFRLLYLQNNNANRDIYIFGICTRFTSDGFHEIVLLSKTPFTGFRKELFT